MQLSGSRLLSLPVMEIHGSSRGIEVELKEIPDPNPSSPLDVLLKLETHAILTSCDEQWWLPSVS
jgi:hypothetical protein